MSLKGKQIIVLAENDYEDLELWYPLLRMREEGAKVTIVGSGTSNDYQSKHGYPVTVDLPASKVDIDKYDAIIVPGGWAPDKLRRYPSVVKLVKNAFDKNKIIAAICHGASVLISAKILEGKTATCYFAIKDDVIYAGANYVDKEVVRDDNIITSRKPDDLPAFCREIISTLK
ncbi:MAG: type 1 glutamine amidotransferase domain-containing protein [Candidatus Hodarchaeota archaeon]